MATELTVTKVCTIPGRGASYSVPKKNASRSKRCPAHQLEYEKGRIQILKQKYKEERRLALAELRSTGKYTPSPAHPTGIPIYNPLWANCETMR